MRAVTIEQPARAGRREWAGLAVLALPLLVLSLDVSILYLAAPELTAALGASATAQLWILDVYGFVIGGFLLTMGAVGDRIGRRRLLLVGGAAFAAASVLAAYAPSAGALITARALLGIAGATLMPSTLGLIRTMFPDPRQRMFAISVWATTFSGGAALGPVLGGALLQWFWWGSVFLLGVPFMVALLLLGPVLLPEARAEHAGTLDLVSVALSLATMLPLVWAVKETAAHGPGTAPAAAGAGGAVLGVVFVRRQRRLDDPMLDLTLFTRRAFVGAVALTFLAILALNGLIFLLPQFLQFVAEEDPLAAGLTMLPLTAVTAVGSLAAPRAAARWGRTRMLTVTATVSALAAVGMGLLVRTAGTDADPVPIVVLATVVVLGLSPFGVLATDLVVGSAPPERAGAAAAISETGGELGVALGVALVGSVVTAVYGARLGASLPVGTAAEVSAAAGEGVAGAVTAAAELPPPAGAALREAALAAFADAVAVAGWVSAGIIAVIVALVVTILREGGSATGPR